MNKRIAAGILLGFICLCHAVYAAPFAVKTLNFQGKGSQGQILPEGEVAMPFLQPENVAAAKINDFLYISQLNALPPKKPGKYLTAAGGISVEGIASQSFEELRNDERIFTIRFNVEACGAYCENHDSYFSFDARSGRFLTLDDLLTPAGMLEMARRLNKFAVAQYQQQLAGLRADLKQVKKLPKTASNQENIDDLEARIELNSSCGGDLREKSGSVPVADKELLEYFRYNSYVVQTGSVEFVRGRCSNHAMRALDDVGDVHLKVAMAALRPYLTAYAKGLLLKEGEGKPGDIYGQVLHGRLGAATPITMMLNKNADHSLGGVYFYDKFRKPILLSGRENGKTLELTERQEGDSADTKASLSLAIDGDGLKGRWVGNKQFDIELRP